MKRTRLEDTLTELIRPQVEGLGFMLWGLTAPSAGHKTVVSLFIEAEGGVVLDDCAKVSRDVAVMLEVEDPIPGAFVLEVSSPGLERKFFEPGQLSGYEGRTLAVKLETPRDGQRNLKGTLLAIGGASFDLKVEDRTERIEFSETKSVTLVHEF